MRIRRTTPPSEEELAALADGSLPPERRAIVEDFVADSPERAALLEEQREVVAAIHSVAPTVEAPAGLRARVEAERRRRAPAPRRRYAWAGGLAAATAVAALAIFLALPGNVPGGPSVAEAAVLTTRPATEPAPAPESPTLLARSVDGVPYPNWLKKFGWKTAGARRDTLDGRRATTVFYEKNGKRVGYTIFEGSALDEPEDATHVVREGVDIAAFTAGGDQVVTWLRSGHTCILSGEGVDRATLAKLAAWNGKGTVPF